MCIFIARYVAAFHVLLVHFHTHGCGPADMNTHISTHTTHIQSENLCLSTERGRCCDGASCNADIDVCRILWQLWVYMQRLLLPGTEVPREDQTQCQGCSVSFPEQGISDGQMLGLQQHCPSCPRLGAQVLDHIYIYGLFPSPLLLVSEEFFLQSWVAIPTIVRILIGF